VDSPIPPGLTHGFLVLSETADFLHKTTAYYAPQAARSLRWDDARLAIAWPDAGVPVVLSDKDAAAPSLAGYETKADQRPSTAGLSSSPKSELAAPGPAHQFGLRRAHVDWVNSEADRRSVRAVGLKLARESVNTRLRCVGRDEMPLSRSPIEPQRILDPSADVALPTKHPHAPCALRWHPSVPISRANLCRSCAPP
jgi:hypothetical protein